MEARAHAGRAAAAAAAPPSSSTLADLPETATDPELSEQEQQPRGQRPSAAAAAAADNNSGSNADQQSSASGPLEPDKWSDSDADAIVRGAKETAQMALSMYQFTKGEGDLNTTQDLFTQAELFAEEANELYKEVRCFSYKVSKGNLFFLLSFFFLSFFLFALLLDTLMSLFSSRQFISSFTRLARLAAAAARRKIEFKYKALAFILLVAPA